MFNMDMDNVHQTYTGLFVYSLPSNMYALTIKFYRRSCVHESALVPSTMWNIYENSLPGSDMDVTNFIPELEISIIIDLLRPVPTEQYKPYINLIFKTLLDSIESDMVARVIFYYYVGIHLQCFPIFLPMMTDAQIRQIQALRGTYAISITDKILDCDKHTGIYIPELTPKGLLQRIHFSPPTKLPIWVSQFTTGVYNARGQYFAIYTPSRLIPPITPNTSRTFKFLT